MSREEEGAVQNNSLVIESFESGDCSGSVGLGIRSCHWHGITAGEWSLGFNLVSRSLLPIEGEEE